MSRPVHRTELSPVTFLTARRASSPTARRWSTGRAGTPTGAGRPGRPAGRAPCGRPASARATAWPSCSPEHARRCSRRTSASRRRAACWWRSTPGSARDEIGYILGHSGARFLFVDAELAAAGRPLDLSGLTRSCGSTTPAPPATPTRTSSPPAARARSRAGVAGRRGDADLDQLHLGHHRPAQGRDVHPPRRLPQRPRRGDRDRARPPRPSTCGRCRCSTATAGASPGRVTAVGGTHVCLRKVDPARIWELLDARGRHPLQRRPDRPDRRRQPPRGAPARAPGHRHVAGAPPSPTLLAQLRELNFRPIHVYGLTETYGPLHRLRLARRVGRAAGRRAGAAARAPGPGPTSIADPVRVVDERDARRAARRRRPWARS